MSLGSLPIMHYSRGILTNMTEVLFLYIAAVKHQKTPYEHRMIRFVYKSCDSSLKKTVHYNLYI